MRLKCIFLLVIFQFASIANGIEVMSIVLRRLLGLTDGAGASDQSMLVIGAGFGRTGTESLCAALTRLGFKTYHGSKVARYGHLPQWNRWFDAGDPAIFGSLRREGFNATTDFPASVAHKELLRRNPTAKVVLSLHPRGAEGWARSYQKVHADAFHCST